jgi:3-oxoacyl-[acyl-carrier-protein] synthase-3
MRRFMIVRDIGIIGMGLWDGEVVTNDRFDQAHFASAPVKDPYRGCRGDDGTIRIAGMEFIPEKHPRTIAAIEKSFLDPFRGTRRRRFFPDEMKVSDAETDAARGALADAGIGPEDVDVLLVQSFLPDEIQPKNAPIIAHNLGITHAPAWEVDSVCNSALTQMTVGASLITSGFARHVLCVQSVAYSRVSDRSVSSSIQEGDMASAFVLGPSPGTVMASSWRTGGSLHAAIKLHWTAPGRARPRRWWERSHESFLIGFDAKLQEKVNGEIAAHALLTCEEALGRVEMRLGDVEVFISHQPMSWYRAFMEDVLALPDGVAFDTFEEYANVNSASLPSALYVARRSGVVGAGKRVLLYCPAAGYTYGAIALRWGER